MKKYGVVVNATIVQEKALAMGLASTKNELTVAQKAFAAYTLMLESSKAAIGDMARTSGSYANQVKAMKANVENLKAEIGRNLLPTLSSWLETINKILVAWNKLFSGPSAIDASLAILETEAKRLRNSIATFEDQIRIWSYQKGIDMDAARKNLQLLNDELKDIEASIQYWKHEKAADIAPSTGASDMSALTGGTTQKGMQMGQDMWSMWAGAAEWGYEDEIINYENSLVTKIDMTAEHFRQMKELTAGNQQEMAEIYRQSAAQIEAIETQKRTMLISSAQTITDRVAMAGRLMMAASDKQNKALFAITKSAAIVSAMVSTYKAVMIAKASAPPPINYVLAAAELAYGLAQVANIKSQSYGGMGGGGGGGGGGAVGTYPASPATGFPIVPTAKEEPKTDITFIFKGHSAGEDAFMDFFIEKFNDSVEVRGARVVATELA